MLKRHDFENRARVFATAIANGSGRMRTRLLGETAARWGLGHLELVALYDQPVVVAQVVTHLARARNRRCLLTGGLAVTQAISNRLQESSANQCIESEA